MPALPFRPGFTFLAPTGRGDNRREMKKGRRLYRQGAESGELAQFQRTYGKRKGRRIYFAVVGKVRRERLAKGRAA